MYGIIPTPPSQPQSEPGIKENENEDGDGKVLGIACFSAISPQHHSIEIGIILSPLLHRSTAGTEVSYLLLSHCFTLGYQRVEWRCNDRNEGSKRATERLGFVKEGVLRRQQVVKGRGRDTAVYGMLGDEWEVVKVALKEWLKESNFEGGRQRRRLEEVRAEIMVAREKKMERC
ncbi:acyl-CoA N-acyltransferase [Stipitochalara longipes BDJ]|nr:acyl-CoA N-acyltransferase [Stipitochalara longipes BDJ]